MGEILMGNQGLLACFLPSFLFFFFFFGRTFPEDSLHQREVRFGVTTSGVSQHHAHPRSSHERIIHGKHVLSTKREARKCMFTEASGC